MAFDEVLFGGTGSEHVSVLMWTNPCQATGPQTISRFLRGYSIYALAVSPNGTRVAAGTKRGLVRVLGLTDGKAASDAAALFEVFHPPAVVSLAFCTDDILASGGLDGRIRLWSVSQGRQLAEMIGHCGGVLALCRIGSLVLASIGADAVLRVWDLDSLDARFESEPFELPRIQALTTLDYSPSEGLLAHPSQTGDLHLYDVKEHFKKRTIRAHDADFAALSYGPQYAATGGAQDAILKVWALSGDPCLMQASASSGILSIGWTGPDTLLTAHRDGSAQTWQIRDGLCAGFRHTGLDLRCVVGLPTEQLARSQAWRERQWRDAKIAEASDSLGRPEQRGHLAGIVRELHERGFSAEAVLLLADAARSQQQPLWELESLLALVAGLDDSPAAVPCLYALALLLENMKEPSRALQYFQKIQQIDKDYLDVAHRISCLANNPLLTLPLESRVRADLTRPDRVRHELRKSTILERKFHSRAIVRAGNPVHCPSPVDAQDVQQAVAEALRHAGIDAQHVDLQHVVALADNGPRELTWVYAPATAEPQGAAFAMEIQTMATGMEFVPCAVFDPGGLAIPSDTSIPDHNDRVERVWTKCISSPVATTWFQEAHKLAIKGLMHLEGRVMANTDDQY